MLAESLFFFFVFFFLFYFFIFFFIYLFIYLFFFFLFFFFFIYFFFHCVVTLSKTLFPLLSTGLTQEERKSSQYF